MAALIKNAALGRHGGDNSLHEDCNAEGRTVPVHTFKSAFSKTPMASAYGTLADIGKALHNVKEVRCKADAPLLTFNEYRQEAQSRGLKDIVCAWAVCGDIDHLVDQTVFDAALKELAGMGASVIAYQTYSHTMQAPRWRVFVFLDEPALPSDYAACWHGLNDVFQHMLDPAAKDIARLNHWPSCPPGQTRKVCAFNLDGNGPAASIKQALVERGSAPVSDGKQSLIFGLPFDVPAYVRRLSVRDDIATAAILRLQEYEETPNNVAWVESLLEYVSADCEYWEWRNMIWAVASLDWSCGERLCRNWSMTVPGQFIEADFRSTWNSYRAGGIGIGTLIHRAKLGGWKPSNLEAQVSLSPTIQPLETPVPTEAAPNAADRWTRETPPFAVVSIADIFTDPPPQPQFIIAEWLPAGVLTLLSAHGGTGKSMLALTASVCVAAGIPFMGKITTQKRVVFFSGEDNAGLIRHRLARICQALSVNPIALLSNLKILDATESPTLFSEVNQAGIRRGMATDMHRLLKEEVESFGAQLIVIDNASDTLDGNENDRAIVRGFVRSLVQLGKANEAGVLLVAHTNKLAAKTGEADEAYSGSTAWHNSARSRLFLGDKKGQLTLTHSKCNLGPLAADVTLMWDSDKTLTIAPTIDPNAMTTTILNMFAALYAAGKFISPHKTATNNAFRVLSSHPGYPSFLTRQDLERIIGTLLLDGWLVEEPFTSGQRKEQLRIAPGGGGLG